MQSGSTESNNFKRNLIKKQQDTVRESLTGSDTLFHKKISSFAG